MIAIENARLFNELRARTTELGSSVAELKMLNEVAQAVSSTLDLRTVLSTVLNASLGVTWANAGAVFRYSRAERAFRLVEAVGWDEALAHSVRELHVAETESAMGEAVARRMPIQLPDLAQRASYPLRDVTLAAGFHSALIVPLVGAERILGAIILMRQEAGEFPAETVRLMQTLASQSVLAIQNARLFREIADKSEQLALASQHKSQFLANMSHELRTPLNAILGYAELLVDGIYGQLPERPRGVLDRIQNNGKHLLALINDVLDLAKIEAGQLTLTLEDYSVPEVVKSVVTATEPLATSKGLKFTAEFAGRPADGARRRAPRLASAPQPGRQCDQIHRKRRGRDPRYCRQRPVRADGARHRAGHSRRRSGTDLWRVSADRQFQYAQEGRNRAGSGDLEAHGRDAGRDDHGRLRYWAKARRSGSYCRSMSMK